MGTKMSRVLHKVTKHAKDFNIEERAYKSIDKPKREMAPRHPSTVKVLQQLEKSQPKDLSKSLLQQEDSNLNERLKQVFVTSDNPNSLVNELNTTQQRSSSKRPLPVSRGSVEPPEYGYVEPEVIPYGKTTLKNALIFISKHHEDAKEWSADQISHDYKLNADLTVQILKYFQPFTLYLPEGYDKPKTFMEKVKKKTDSVIAAAQPYLFEPGPGERVLGELKGIDPPPEVAKDQSGSSKKSI